MDHRFHLGGTTSVLDADTDDAGEEDDGNETAQEKPGGGVLGFGALLLFFLFLRCCRLGREVVEVLRNRG